MRLAAQTLGLPNDSLWTCLPRTTRNLEHESRSFYPGAQGWWYCRAPQQKMEHTPGEITLELLGVPNSRGSPTPGMLDGDTVGA